MQICGEERAQSDVSCHTESCHLGFLHIAGLFWRKRDRQRFNDRICTLYAIGLFSHSWQCSSRCDVSRSLKFLHPFILHFPSYFWNRGAAWEEAFLETLRKVEEENIFKHITTARFASRTLELELEENTKTIVPYFSSTFILMALFSVVTCMMTDWVRSKPWLGLLGNVSAAMATVAAFGLCIYLGVDFIGLNLAAPFLMIGEWNIIKEICKLQ